MGTPHLVTLPWHSRDIPITFHEKYCAILGLLKIYKRHIIVLYRTMISLCHHYDITLISLWYIWNEIGCRQDVDRNVWNGFNGRSGCFFWKKDYGRLSEEHLKCTSILNQNVQLCWRFLNSKNKIIYFYSTRIFAI